MAEEKVIRIAHDGAGELLDNNNAELESVTRELSERTKLLNKVELELADLEAQLKKLNEKKTLRKGDAQMLGALAAFQNRVRERINTARKRRKVLVEDVLRAEERKLFLVEEG